jgi:hypothetical protein
MTRRENIGTMSLQVFFQDVGGVTFSSGVTAEHDLIRPSDIFRDLFIKRILFRYALATVVSFLSMNQMMMKLERIVRLHRVFAGRTASTEILVDMGTVVVHDDNHPAGFSTRAPDLCASGTGSFKSLHSRRTSSTPRL